MSERHSLSTISLAWKTIVRRKARSIYIISLIALLSFALFCGTLLIDGAQRGVENTSSRLGADVMVVPKGYDAKLEGILLRSEPSAFYFEDDGILKEISQVEGVKAASPQLFLRSLDAACCSVPVQLIVYDAASDFAISPWIESTYTEGGERENSVWIGSLVEAIPGDEILLFGQSFFVMGRLGETGSGFDSSIFMEEHTARKMIELSESLAKAAACPRADAVSCVMVKVGDGYSISDTADNILKSCSGVQVIETQGVLSGISSDMEFFSSMLKLLIAGTWLMAVVVLIIVFVFTLNARKREFGMLRVIGATKTKLVTMVLSEAAIMCVIGSVLGCFMGCLIVVPFKTLIAQAMRIPYIMPSTSRIVGFAAISTLIGTLTGPFTCVFAAYNLTKCETYLLVRD